LEGSHSEAQDVGKEQMEEQLPIMVIEALGQRRLGLRHTFEERVHEDPPGRACAERIQASVPARGDGRDVIPRGVSTIVFT
jgi:hypothetical protein